LTPSRTPLWRGFFFQPPCSRPGKKDHPWCLWRCTASKKCLTRGCHQPRNPPAATLKGNPPTRINPATTGPPGRQKRFSREPNKNWHDLCSRPGNSGFGALGTGRPGNPHSYDRQADLQPPRRQKRRMQDSVAPGATRFQGALVQAGRGIPSFIHRRAGFQPPGFQRNPTQDSVAGQSGRPPFRGPWYRQAGESPL
jgi:hypothetical protein